MLFKMSFADNKPFWESFISLYKSKPCLWNIKSKEYKQLRNDAYEALVEKCKEIWPLADVKFVRKKIDSLRAGFRRELREIRKSKKTGASTDSIYEPSLWYFQLLLFIQDQEEVRPGICSMASQELEEETQSETRLFLFNMRYYHLDGSYHERPLDTEFGWYLDDIVIDEATPTFQEQNQTIKEISRLRRRQCDQPAIIEDNSSNSKNDVEESLDALETLSLGSTIIQNIDLNIPEETPTNSIIYEQSVEGFVENPESNFFKQALTCKIPDKSDMMALINPVNPESKALLSVVSYSKYQRLDDRETNEEILKTVNFRTTNSKHLLSNEYPNFNFVLNDNEVDVNRELASEIQNYHATKEDNMLSLMMELINTDMDSNLGDMSELNNSVNELNSMGVIGTVETSDLGNSIHSSILSKEGNGFREKKHFLDLPNRSDILSSLGLSEDIDKSIENFVQEKTEMHQQLIDIKKSFEIDEKKLDTLMDQAATLQNDLRETTHLSNLIHLLNSRPEQVKNKKLPFRIFHQQIDDVEANENLII